MSTKYICEHACGATVTVEGWKPIVGKRYVVFTSPAQGHNTPQIEGKSAPCMFNCPSKVKDSGRRYVKVFCFKENDNGGHLVSCKIKKITKVG